MCQFSRIKNDVKKKEKQIETIEFEETQQAQGGGHEEEGAALPLGLPLDGVPGTLWRACREVRGRARSSG